MISPLSYIQHFFNWDKATPSFYGCEGPCLTALRIIQYIVQMRIVQQLYIACGIFKLTGIDSRIKSLKQQVVQVP